MAQVTIYTTPTCPYCHMAKEFFATHHVTYTEHDVASSEQARDAMIQKSGQLGVPVIAIDDKVVVGFDEKRISELLHIN